MYNIKAGFLKRINVSKIFYDASVAKVALTFFADLILPGPHNLFSYKAVLIEGEDWNKKRRRTLKKIV